MAWYAELKRRKWYCIMGIDMISIHKKYLYDEWYNSLTEEQKLRLEEYCKKEKERKEREAQEAIHRLALMTGIIRSKCPDKYHGVYDEFGFPRL